jgi:hypothetical protein
MTDSALSNRSASVRQRLLNLTRTRGEEFQRVLTRFALERLLYRLSLSPYRERFLLKGAMLFVAWFPESHRPTKDLDLSGYGDSSREMLMEIFRTLCGMEGSEDGMEFLPGTITCTEIREETEYGGLRINLVAKLGTAEIPVQVDIGFGDIITPAPEEIDFPVLLNLPAPHLRAYPKETVVCVLGFYYQLLDSARLPALQLMPLRDGEDDETAIALTKFVADNDCRFIPEIAGGEDLGKDHMAMMD